MFVKVDTIVWETPDAVTLYLDDSENPLVYQPGQFLTLCFSIGGQKISRSYSFCTCPFTDSRPAITVKRVPGGLVSSYIHENIRPGDELEVLHVGGLFTTPLNPENKRKVLLFGGGSGITPLLSIARAILQEEPASEVTLIYANRNLDSIIYKDELLALMLQAWQGRFWVLHILEEIDYYPIREMRQGHQLLRGRLNTELIEQLVHDVDDSFVMPRQYFICGPSRMIELVVTALQSLGVPENNILREDFDLPVIDPPAHALTEINYLVKIRFKGKLQEINVAAGQTILAAALEQGITLSHSCRGALCGTCRAKLLAGQVVMNQNYALTDEELAAGHVLTCVGRPITSEVFLDFDL